jgi:hypothetical protein
MPSWPVAWTVKRRLAQPGRAPKARGRPCPPRTPFSFARQWRTGPSAPAGRSRLRRRLCGAAAATLDLEGAVSSAGRAPEARGKPCFPHGPPSLSRGNGGLVLRLPPGEARLRRRLCAPAAATLDLEGAVSSAGRAPALQAGGRRFDPVTAHQEDPSTSAVSSGPSFSEMATAEAGDSPLVPICAQSAGRRWAPKAALRFSLVEVDQKLTRCHAGRESNSQKAAQTRRPQRRGSSGMGTTSVFCPFEGRFRTQRGMRRDLAADLSRYPSRGSLDPDRFPR